MEKQIDMTKFLSQGDWQDVISEDEMALVWTQGESLGQVTVNGKLTEMKSLLVHNGKDVVSGTYIVFSPSSIWKSRWKTKEGFLDWIERVYQSSCHNRYIETDGWCTACGEFHQLPGDS